MGITVGGFPQRAKDFKFDDQIAELIEGENFPSLQTVLEKIDQKLDVTKTNLTAALEVYVDPALGSDSPDKGTGTGLDAYASINYALSEIQRKFNPNGQQIRVNLPAGTLNFTEQTILIDLATSDQNFCDVVIQGVSTAETTIQCNTPGIPLFLSRTSSTRYCFRSITFEGLVTGSTHVVEIRESSYVDLSFCNIIGTFPANNLAATVVSTNGSLRLADLRYGNLTSSGLIFAGNSGKVDLGGNITATVGTISNFTDGCLKIFSSSVFKSATANFTGDGTVTGKKYVIDGGADFEFEGEAIADLEQLPGDQPGEFIAVAQYAIAKYGEDTYTDYSLGANGMVLSRNLRSGGFGHKGTDSGSMRRFDGNRQTNVSALAYGNPMLITTVNFSCIDAVSGRTLEIRSYDMDGADGQVHVVIPIDQQGDRLGFLYNAKIFIEASRRLSFFMNGSFVEAQADFNYRTVFNVL